MQSFNLARTDRVVTASTRTRTRGFATTRIDAFAEDGDLHPQIRAGKHVVSGYETDGLSSGRHRAGGRRCVVPHSI